MPALGLDDDADVCDAARSYITRETPRTKVASIATLGELRLKAGEFKAQARKDALERLDEWLDNEMLGTFGLGPDERIFDVALQLRRIDHLLTPCDATIIASMVIDPNADVLVTMDTFASRPRLIDYVRGHEKGFQLINNDSQPRRRRGGNVRSGNARQVEERQRARRGRG